jgi:hypothetical protein
MNVMEFKSSLVSLLSGYGLVAYKFAPENNTVFPIVIYRTFNETESLDFDNSVDGFDITIQIQFITKEDQETQARQMLDDIITTFSGVEGLNFSDETGIEDGVFTYILEFKKLNLTGGN